MAELLLHIGFPKAGSTYMQQWLEQHPDIYFQPKRNAQGFYNAWELAKYVQKSDKTTDKYAMSCEDFTLWQSEPYIYGLRGSLPYDYRKFQQNLCDTLYNLYPTAKILIVTRGYTTLFHSIYAQYVGMAGTFTFDELLKEHWDMFTNMLDYNYTINLYRQKFGTDKVILLPYELLCDDSEKFLSLIEESIGVTQPFRFPKNRANQSLDRKTLTAYYKASHLVYNLLKPFSEIKQYKWYLYYMQVVRKKTPHPFLKWCSQFVSKELETETPRLQAILNTMQGKAEILRNEKLHQPYLKEYLL